MGEEIERASGISPNRRGRTGLAILAPDIVPKAPKASRERRYHATSDLFHDDRDPADLSSSSETARIRARLDLVLESVSSYGMRSRIDLVPWAIGSRTRQVDLTRPKACVRP
jgi:hypothetical protein